MQREPWLPDKLAYVAAPRALALGAYEPAVHAPLARALPAALLPRAVAVRALFPARPVTVRNARRAVRKERRRLTAGARSVLIASASFEGERVSWAWTERSGAGGGCRSGRDEDCSGTGDRPLVDR
ncbi:hypothetical protein TRAPUB_7085 [Trametes pubescens]|uniref:Uncharacterized protein n=1 Tax=Trametes pubescens TaxID=154538 RepID=A0A1M2V454_TRAPU|nr:hypothetical protein TRAPUB_7085 [Trametes pubescens]